MDSYHKAYYLAHKEELKAKSKERYNANKEAIQGINKLYRKTEKYKEIKKVCDGRVKDMRKATSNVSKKAEILGTKYSLSEDTIILEMKEQLKNYREIAEVLKRSIKGIEYRYNLLIKINNEK